MKIAVVAPSSIPSRRANSIQVMKMTQALASLGHEVRLAAPLSGSPRSFTQPAWDELALHYGLHRRFPIHWLPSHPALRRYDFAIRATWWARSWRAQLVYTRLPQAAALSSALGLPTIFEVHDLPRGRLHPWLLRRFLAGRGARRLVVITRALAADLQKELGIPTGASFLLVAPDGVDLARYQDLPAPEVARQQIGHLQGRSAAFTVGFTGHLYSGRGAELILDLASLLPEMTFMLVGGEPAEVERLKSQAAARNLENVILTGFIPNAALPLYQAACDVLIMPYQAHVAASSGGDIASYLSPMKLFEYLACGRAILSSDLPVLREVLTSENSVLLPPDDLRAWRQTLLDLYADSQRRLALGARARSDAAAYTWEARAARILLGLEVSID